MARVPAFPVEPASMYTVTFTSQQCRSCPGRAISKLTVLAGQSAADDRWIVSGRTRDGDLVVGAHSVQSHRLIRDQCVEIQPDVAEVVANPVEGVSASLKLGRARGVAFVLEVSAVLIDVSSASRFGENATNAESRRTISVRVAAFRFAFRARVTRAAHRPVRDRGARRVLYHSS